MQLTDECACFTVDAVVKRNGEKTDCFAAHLQDNGADIKYKKELLGHFNIKTTERYLHVSKK